MYNELIERLRVAAEWAEGNEWEIPLMLHDDLVSAADALEKVIDEFGKIAQSGRLWMCPYCKHAKNMNNGRYDCEMGEKCRFPFSAFEWRGVR